MASGHVNRANKAEHMAAPHRCLRREDFPCQFGAVHTWPISVICELPRAVCSRDKSGRAERRPLTATYNWTEAKPHCRKVGG